MLLLLANDIVAHRVVVGARVARLGRISRPNLQRAGARVARLERGNLTQSGNPGGLHLAALVVIK